MGYLTIPPSRAVDPGTAATASGDVQDLTVSGLSGNLDGDYIFEFQGVLDAANRVLSLYANGADLATCSVNYNLVSIGVSEVFAHQTTAIIKPAAALEVAALPVVSIVGRVSVKSGGQCAVFAHFEVLDSTPKYLFGEVSGHHTPAAEVTSLGIHGSAAGSIKSGSIFRIQKTGFTA